LDLAQQRIPHAIDLAADGVTNGVHAGMQIYVSHHGVAQAEAAVGWASGSSPMTSRTLLPWFCCIKPLYAIAFALLWERGLLDLHEPIHEAVPEFAGGGKDRLTFWHLLTHTSGLRPDPFYQALWKPKAQVLASICGATLPDEAVPGANAYYGQFWAWAILSEAIERRAGMSHEDFVRCEILEPLGIADCRPRVNDAVWEQDEHRIGLIFDTESDQSPRVFSAMEERWQFGAYGPGAVGIGSAGALGRIAEVFLPDPPRALLRTQTVEAMCSRHRVGLWDEHWGGFLSWGLGLVSDGWLFGSRCTPNTVGHLGYNTSFFCVDRTANVVVACIANGLAGAQASASRDRGITDAIYAGLGVGAPTSAPRIVAVDPPAESGTTSQDARAEARFWRPSVSLETSKR
jgi:CubicO group peptidase (beta-lactamase class C family)